MRHQNTSDESTWKPLDRVLLVTGMFRSGTSLVGMALNVHWDVHVALEPIMPFFKTLRNTFLRDVLGREFNDNLPLGVNFLYSDEDFDRFARCLTEVVLDQKAVASVAENVDRIAHNEVKGINAGLQPGLNGSVACDIKPGIAGDVLASLLRRFSEPPAGWVGLKQTFCEELSLPLLGLFGEGRVIHILRDPRAIVASRNYGRYFKETGTRYPLGFLIHAWRRSVRLAMRFSGMDRFMAVQYEDLVACPEEVLWKTTELLGIDYDPGMSDPSRYRDAAGRPWRSNSSFRQSEQIDVGATDRWKDVLPEADVRFIEYHCREEMAQLGYSPSGRIPSDPPPLQEDVELINPWMRDCYGCW